MDITVKKQNVIAAYNAANEETKEWLEILFGKNIIPPKNITDRIKSYEDACRELGCEPKCFSGMSKDEVAYIKLKTIVRALNEGWVPDWEDSDQHKYWVWFYMSDLKEWYSRVVLCSVDVSDTLCSVAASYACYDATSTYSNYGSRLAFRTHDLAIYCGNTFASLWAEYLLIL